LVDLDVELLAAVDVDLDRAAVASEVEEWLDGLARESVENDLYTDRLVFNRSYLVDREDETAFEDAVADLEDAYEGATVQQSGPFAPYSFVDIQIGAQ
ncbi:GvpL/GvpF family gas vesicle protein, partial [Halobium palmae]